MVTFAMNSRLNRIACQQFGLGRFPCLAGLVLSVFTIGAEIVTLTPVADTTLQEFFPNNNFGAYTHVAAGATGSPKANGLPNTT